MSRSYRRLILKSNDRYFKRLSNRKIRAKLKTLTAGFKSAHFFKIITDSYNISDYKEKPKVADGYLRKKH